MFRRYGMRKPLAVLGVMLAIAACNGTYVPKPRGFYNIELPKEHAYKVFDQPGYPYKFEYPVYANVLKDSTFFGDETENPWWINLDIPSLNGRIYISYKQLPQNDFGKMVNDAFNLTSKHTYKADKIDDSLMRTPNRLHGIFFNAGGNVASAYQFFLSDTTRHFLRGALYFDATPNEDSLRPVNDFMKKDIEHLINTLQWK